MADETIILNNKKMTEEEFKLQKEELEKKKIILVEVKPNEYRTRLQE